MNIIFAALAWEQYQHWLAEDMDTARKINELIKDIMRNGLSRGIGKPEALKGRKEWSRRINREHRLVYTLDSEKNVVIKSCKGHYID